MADKKRSSTIPPPPRRNPKNPRCPKMQTTRVIQAQARQHWLKFLLILMDTLAALGALLLGGVVYGFSRGFDELLWYAQGWWHLGAPWWPVYLAPVMMGLATFWYWGHYTRRRTFFDELLEIFKIVLLMAMVDAALLFLTKAQFSRLWFGVSWGTAVVVVPAMRMLLKRWLIRLGWWQLPTVIVGTGELARETYLSLSTQPSLGYQVEALLSLHCDREEQVEFFGETLPVYSLVGDPAAHIINLGRPNIIVALEAEELELMQPLLARLSQDFPNINVAFSFPGMPLYGTEIQHFFSHEVLLFRMRNNLARRGPRTVKRLFDLVVSFLLLILLAPLFWYLVSRIRRDGGQAFFSHMRVGQGSKRFGCYKFRTMVPNAQQVLQELLERDPEARKEWETDFKLRNDPRVTPIGQFLRRTSLDELPQLWNVIKGEMSLVGPRPIVDAELDYYGEHVSYYLEAKPGMTGLWQISGRNDTGYQRRVYLDAWYVKNWSLWYDVIILFKTVGVVMNRKGAY